jgi:hypothetical protein
MNESSTTSLSLGETEFEASTDPAPAAPHSAPTDNHTVAPPTRWREPICLVLLVVLSDLTIYRGSGFAGIAALLAAASILFAIGVTPRRPSGPLTLFGLMLLLLCIRLVWCGSGLSVTVGFAVLVGVVACLAGHHPWIGETLVFGVQSIMCGYRGLTLYYRAATRAFPSGMRANWLPVLLPLAALSLFSLLFVLANPDMAHALREQMDRVLDFLHAWFIDFPVQPTEVLFWLVAAWVVAGFLRPAVEQVSAAEPITLQANPDAEPLSRPVPMFAAIRNTLVVVIVLFAAYLLFEFKTLWFRVFPEGFYYSGYAHEGAAWLTVALALATAMLSAIFRGAVLRDPRLPTLRRMAWLWSLENFLLAAAVYHRLFIYIGFNRMTRLRVVGLYGMSAVVVGFLWVLWKIRHNHDFVWLVRRHLWTLAAAIYLYSITPVDTVAMKYNVQRILAGDPAPCVQISVHPISAEGYLVLLPLIDSGDSAIADGLKAMLAERDDAELTRAKEREREGWTSHQVSEEFLRDKFRSNRQRWSEYSDGDKRASALKAFHAYAYQWF